MRHRAWIDPCKRLLVECDRSTLDGKGNITDNSILRTVGIDMVVYPV